MSEFNLQNIRALIGYIVETEKRKKLLMCPTEMDMTKCDFKLPCGICKEQYYQKMENDLWNFITAPHESCDRY